MVISAEVGGGSWNDGSPSTVKLPTIFTITARGGGKACVGCVVGRPDVHWNSAGNGYSGGGSGGSAPTRGSVGGTNGGNGVGSYGGHGTGEDIGVYIFRHFNLSPGEGGQPCCKIGNYHYGGGGGGVMVNGEGPFSYEYQGNGYGGGGGGENYHNRPPPNDKPNIGLPGVILVEVVKA